MSVNPVRRNCARPHRCSREVRLAVMARSPLTHELTEQQHEELDRYLTAWSWAEGDPILLAGEEVSGSYMVVAGHVRITRDTVDGRQITLAVAGLGDIIGPLHTHPVQAEDSAWAIETTCALYLPAAALAEVVERYPKVALAIVRMQQDQMGLGREREAAQVSTTVEQRVAATVHRLDEKFGRPRPDGSSLLQVRLRRDDIAGMAGTTLESASRVMSRMKKDGIIDSGREWIAVTDHDALVDRINSG